MADSRTGGDVLSEADESRNLEIAEQLLAEGREAEAAGDRWKAIELYEQAFEMDPDDEEICFHLAYHLDLVGEDSEALHLYEQACSGQAAVNAMVNLAVVYEDQGEYARAERCLRRVLDADPNHDRARLYMKDVQASRRMYYDEEQQRLSEKYSHLLETPIGDFELSVRARNCLTKMNIRTLGDLLRTTEPELLAYKNFGDTSLQEIKSMLAQRGLSLGQAREDRDEAAREEVIEQLAGTGNEAMLDQPVTDLELSVRARKALSLLGIVTIGDLIARTEAELLGIKNFGQTSLNEIKERLSDHGLSLRVLEE